MTEIEKLAETYLRTGMTAETFMRKARTLRNAAQSGENSPPTTLGMNLNECPPGPAPATAESTPVPTESATEHTSTDVVENIVAVGVTFL